MTALSLTSFEQIRGVLTVSQADLPDETLEAYGLDDDLTVDLDGWIPSWESVTDEKPARLLRLYAKYFCAGTVAGAAPVFILKKSTDGATEGQRSDVDGFLWLATLLLDKAATYRRRLLEELGQEVVAATGYTLISRVVPARDSVVESR